MISLAVHDLYEGCESVENSFFVSAPTYKEADYRDVDPVYQPSWVGNLSSIEYKGGILGNKIRNGFGFENISYSNQGYPYREFKLSDWKDNKMSGKSIHTKTDGFDKTGNKSQEFYLGDYENGLRNGKGISAFYRISHGEYDNVCFSIEYGNARDCIYQSGDETGDTYAIQKDFTVTRKFVKDPEYIYGCRVVE